jgi:hypothetical protein
MVGGQLTGLSDSCSAKQSPVEPLNVIANDVIGVLVDARNLSENISYGLFSPSTAQTANTPEPCSLEAKLQYARSLAQEVRRSLSDIANKV